MTSKSINAWDAFYEQFMRSSLKSCENLFCYNFDFDKSIRSQICTCSDNWAVMICANLWPDLIIVFHVRATQIFKRFWLYELITILFGKPWYHVRLTIHLHIIQFCDSCLKLRFIIPAAQRNCWGGILVSLRLAICLSVCPTCHVRSVTPTVLDGFFPY